MKKEILFSVQKMNKIYGHSGKNDANVILDDITFDLYKNDFTIVMGSSGAGKSTLLYCISGMDNVTSGKVLFNNLDIASLSENRLSKLRRKNMGFIFQQMNLMPNLSILENVIVPGYLIKSRKDVKYAGNELLRKVGIKDLGGRMPHQVSGGQLQRAAIARSLINDPDVLFADEPTGALNSKASEAILDILSSHNSEGQSILMVTHDIKAALRANRIIYIKDGGIRGEKILLPYLEENDYLNREELLRNWLIEMGW